MKIVSNINGNTKTTSYGNKLFYRSSPNGNYTQVKRAFYRSSPNANYTQVYLYDNVAPSITVTSSTATTATAVYTLTATISDTYSAITNIYVNNVAYPFTAGSQTVYLSKAFTLAEGVNYFTIKAIDEAQNIQEITVSKTLKIPSGFTTDLTGYYDWVYSFMDWTDYGHADIPATNNNYIEAHLDGRCGGFQHGGHHDVVIQKLIPIGQTNCFIDFNVTGAAQSTEYKGGCEYVIVDIYDADGNLTSSTTLYTGSIIYSTTVPTVITNFDLSPYNDGAHFFRFRTKYGHVAGAEWAVFTGNMALTFS